MRGLLVRGQPRPSVAARAAVLARVAGIVWAPGATLHTVVAERAASQGILVTLVATGIGGGAAAAPFALTSQGAASLAWVLAGALLGLMLGVPFTAAWAGLCHGAARLLGQRGPFGGLFAAFAYINALIVLQAPLAVVAPVGGEVGSLISTVGNLAIIGWGLGLQALAIRANYQTSIGIASVAIILALVATLVILVTLVLAVVVVALLGLFALLR